VIISFIIIIKNKNMESSNSVNLPGSDCVLCKHELKPVYGTLIVPHLMHSSQPVLNFDEWYAQLDSWGRGIVHASQLIECLIGSNYNDWGEISRLIPGFEVEKVTSSIKLNQALSLTPRASPRLAGE
jgi:hypothetical protein